MVNHHFSIFFAILIAIIQIVFPISSLANEMLSPNDINIVTQGRVLYQEHCASCHGENLEGEENWRKPKADRSMPAPPHDASGHTWHHTDAVLFNLTKFGLAKYLNQPNFNTSMPVYDGVLTDEEIKAVLSFIKSSWPVEIRKRHDKLNAQ